MQWLNLGPIKNHSSNSWHCFHFIFCLFGKIIKMFNLRLFCCCEGKKILGEKVTNMKYVWDRGFLRLLLGTWPSDHQHPGFFDYLQIKFFFSFNVYVATFLLFLSPFVTLETSCDKPFVKILSNIAPDISGRGAACYCHFQAPGENKNIASQSRHVR